MSNELIDGLVFTFLRGDETLAQEIMRKYPDHKHIISSERMGHSSFVRLHQYASDQSINMRVYPMGPEEYLEIFTIGHYDYHSEKMERGYSLVCVEGLTLPEITSFVQFFMKRIEVGGQFIVSSTKGYSHYEQDWIELLFSEAGFDLTSEEGLMRTFTKQKEDEENSFTIG